MMNTKTGRLLALPLLAAAFACRTRPGDPQLTDTTVSTRTATTSTSDSARVTRDTASVSTTARTDTTRTTTTDSSRVTADTTRRSTTVRTDSAAGTVALPTTAMTDADIAQVVATIDRSEIEAARLAIGKVSNTDVRAFAQTMIDEHSTSVRELATMGTRLGWPSIDTTVTGRGAERTDSSRMSRGDTTRMQTADSSMARQMQTGRDNAQLASLHSDHRRMMDQLRSTPTGASFDKAYITSQVEAHQKALGIVRQLSEQARDSALRTHLTNAVTKVQSHLERAQSLQRSIAS